MAERKVGRVAVFVGTQWVIAKRDGSLLGSEREGHVPRLYRTRASADDEVLPGESIKEVEVTIVVKGSEEQRG